MNFRTIGLKTIGSVLCLGTMLGLTSCSILDYTIAYVYVTSSKDHPGGVNAYAADYLTGTLVQVKGSPFAAGNNPVTLAAAPNGLFIYVVNHDDSTIQEFAVNDGGVLTSKNTYPTTGTFPTAAAIDPAGKFLYVTYTYQTGYSAATPGPGGVTIFPINADNSLGTATDVKVGNNPISVVASNFNHFVYVLDQEPTPNAAILGFAQDPTSGALTPVPGTVISTVAGKTVATGFSAGTVPSAMVEEPTARFLYVTDEATNQMYGKVVLSSGALQSMVNGPFSTGQFPVGISVDPRGKYLYTVNYNAATVSAYAIDTATGNPTGSVGSASSPVRTGPTCLTIEAALGIYAYVTNNLDGTVSGLQLDPHNGGLTDIQNTPFPAAGFPTCAVTVPNGAHASQIVQP